MRATGAFIAGLAGAIALAEIFWMAPVVQHFESATGFGPARKAADFLQIFGIVYLMSYTALGLVAIVPFTIAFRILAAWSSVRMAGTFAGVLAAVPALVPVALVRETGPENEIHPLASFAQLLPGALACGLVGGLIFAWANHGPKSASP